MNPRLPPFSDDIERAVLGAILYESTPALFKCQEHKITPDHFFRPMNRMIFEVMTDLSAKGKMIDVLILTDKLKSLKQLKSCGGEGAIHKLVDDCATPSALPEYLNLLHDYYKRRRSQEILQEGMDAIHSSDPRSDVILSGVVNKHLDLLDEINPISSPAEIHERVKERWVEAKKRGSMGYPSFCYAIENIIGSYVAPESVVIAGRPSDGKTSLLLNELVDKADKHDVPCAIASLEMDEPSLRARIAGGMCGVSTFRMRRGQWDSSDMRKMDEAFKKLAKLPLYITDEVMTIDQIQSWFLHMKTKHDIQMAAVDYLQLIPRNNNPDTTASETIGAYSSALKRLAKRMNVSMFILSQLSRGGDRNRTKSPPAPTLEALRDSGVIEQDADIVLMIYKEPGLDMDVFAFDQDWPMCVSVAKHRHGPVGDVQMQFIRSEQRFVAKSEYEGVMRERVVDFEQRRKEHQETLDINENVS